MWIKAMLLLVALVFPPFARAQSSARPMALDALQLEILGGEWHEIAAFGWWPHRLCITDTRYTWTVRNPRTIDVRRSCATGSGVETRIGRIRASGGASRPGQLSATFAPVVLSWIPGAWSDYWVLGRGEDSEWLLVGDRRRQSLAVLSRWAVLDEAALAAAIAIARHQGFDVDRLLSVPQTRRQGSVPGLPHAFPQQGRPGWGAVPTAPGADH